MSSLLARIIQGFQMAGQILAIAITLDTVGGEKAVPSLYLRVSGREYELHSAQIRRNS